MQAYTRIFDSLSTDDRALEKITSYVITLHQDLVKSYEREGSELDDTYRDTDAEHGISQPVAISVLAFGAFLVIAGSLDWFRVTR